MDIHSSRILDLIDQYVFCKNKDGFYIYVNEPFAQISGCVDKDEVIGKTDHDLIWKDQACIHESTDRAILKGKPFIRQDMLQTRVEGTSKILLTKKPLLSESGDIIGVIGNFFDCKNRLLLETKGDFDPKKRRLHLGFVPEWLSFAEVRVCFYIIQGFSASKISEKSGISISTVRYHIENIKNKMQCHSKGEIVEVAMKTGIAWTIINQQHLEGVNYEQ